MRHLPRIRNLQKQVYVLCFQGEEDGYVQISNIFEQTANNEKEHAKLWFKLLHDGMPDTVTNLKDAAAGENFEWTDMYARMAKEAREEGFDDIADTMEGVLAIEKTHEQRYVALLNNIEDGTVFEKAEETLWECLNCGHLHTGKTAPEYVRYAIFCVLTSRFARNY